MQYRQLGKTGIRVSVLGFGCMRFATLGAPDRIDETLSTRLLHQAIDAGVNYVDTAYFYHSGALKESGEGEPFVGRALAGGWRERVNLVTKLPQQITRTRVDMDGFIEQQLRRMQTDHFDVYLVHALSGRAWDRMRDLGVREFLDSVLDRGLARFVGFSFHGEAADFPRIIEQYDRWSVAQIQYNYMDIDFQAGQAGLDYAADRGLGLVVMEPLKGGRLAANLPPDMQAVFDGRPEPWSPAEWALRFVLNQPGVSLLLSSMPRPEQLAENLQVADEARPSALTPDQLAVYAAAREAMRSRIRADCTSCRYCQPCPEGVNIPEVLAALNAAYVWKTNDAWTTGYSPITGKPDLCTKCGACEETCPQGLPIRDLLDEARERFGKRD